MSSSYENPDYTNNGLWFVFVVVAIVVVVVIVVVVALAVFVVSVVVVVDVVVCLSSLLDVPLFAQRSLTSFQHAIARYCVYLVLVFL